MENSNGSISLTTLPFGGIIFDERKWTLYIVSVSAGEGRGSTILSLVVFETNGISIMRKHWFNVRDDGGI